MGHFLRVLQNSPLSNPPPMLHAHVHLPTIDAVKQSVLSSTRTPENRQAYGNLRPCQV